MTEPHLLGLFHLGGCIAPPVCFLAPLKRRRAGRTGPSENCISAGSRGGGGKILLRVEVFEWRAGRRRPGIKTSTRRSSAATSALTGPERRAAESIFIPPWIREP